MACLVLGAVLSGCAPTNVQPLAPIPFAGQTMGTTYTVKVASLPEGVSRSQLHERIQQTLDHVNRLMSTYREDSDISRFNRHHTDQWFGVSPETATVVAEALRVSRASGGAFDPTVGPLVELWSFGPARRPRQVPGAAAVASAMQGVGYTHLEVRISPPALRKHNVDARLDLSAIAKGFAVDRVASILAQSGVDRYMIEVGGEMRVHGVKPSGQVWRIGIEAPKEDRRAVWKAFGLRDMGLATSGDYRNYFKSEGKRYSHTLDPRTGRPVDHDLASVSVIDPSCMQADAMATALMVLGPREGYAFAVERHLAVVFVVREQGGFSERTTPAFEELILKRVIVP